LTISSWSREAIRATAPAQSKRVPIMTISQADHQAIDRVVEVLRGARRLLFITGAGLSADSGLPTYRGPTGLYEAGRLTAHGIPIEAVLSGEMFASRPEVTWQAILELEQPTRAAKPNRGHQVIAEMEGHFDAVWTLTQNVDGLHRRAGSRQILDVHGDLHVLACTLCDHVETVTDYDGLDVPPRCPRCRGIVRPDVVLFGEELPEEKLARLWSEFAAGFDLVFSVGTSSAFPYIMAPVLRARRLGIPTVEINPRATAVSSGVDVKIAGGAAEVLDRIWLQYLAR
jgi:NAD-dependent deacetylase